jgi:hypothetical protein
MLSKLNMGTFYGENKSKIIKTKIKNNNKLNTNKQTPKMTICI